MSARTGRFLCVWLLLVGLAWSHDARAIDAPHSPDCDSCHIGHGASYPVNISQLCEGCHFEGGPARAVETHSSLSIDNDYGNWHVNCWDCHDAHSQQQDDTWGTTYGMLLRVALDAQIKEIDPGDPGPFYTPLSIIRTVTSSNVEHTSPNTFVDVDGGFTDDICQVCHEQTLYYEPAGAFNFHSDYGADTQPGGECVLCHSHDAGFSPAGGSCTSCHAQAQGATLYRRQVVGVGGDFERTSHHVSDGSTTEIVTDDDCVVCHDQSQHQSNPEPEVYLNDPDGGLPHTYDGGGASVESFCLNCHDADGSLAFDSDADSGDGYQPFSDGWDPPDIATGWTSASHNTSPAAALADEACLACHGGPDGTRSSESVDRNAHGSDHGSLRSEQVAGTLVVNVEEDLCYACHDGGVASTDIESEFTGTATFTDSSGALINTHHDVSDADQAYSGAVIECSDCHDPHAANATNKLLADPDTEDGVTPVAGLSWSGSSWQSEWCLGCHDGSYPSSITPPANALVDIAATYPDSRGDQHGASDASNKVALRAGSGYQRGDILECTTCHNPGHGDDESGTVYPNLFNLRSVIYAADGVTPLTPDTSWDPGNPNVVRLIDLSNSNADANTNGKAWCSTCHPNPMGGNKDSGCLDGNCHHHGTNSF